MFATPDNIPQCKWNILLEASGSCSSKEPCMKRQRQVQSEGKFKFEGKRTVRHHSSTIQQGSLFFHFRENYLKKVVIFNYLFLTTFFSCSYSWGRFRIFASDLVLVSPKSWFPRIFGSDLVLVSPKSQIVGFPGFWSQT